MHYRNIPKTLLFLLLCCPSMGLTGCSAVVQGDTGSFSPADYVNPFIGADPSTSAAGVYRLGKTFPGRRLPTVWCRSAPTPSRAGQQPRVQLRAHDHRRVRLHADERRGLVRRPGQPAGHADDRPAAKDRGQGGRIDRGLPLPITTRPRKPRARGITAPADRLRHPCRKFGHPALRHPALHLSRGRTVAHPDRPGAPRRRHGRAAIHRGGGQAHHRRVGRNAPPPRAAGATARDRPTIRSISTRRWTSRWKTTGSGAPTSPTTGYASATRWSASPTCSA